MLFICERDNCKRIKILIAPLPIIILSIRVSWREDSSNLIFLVFHRHRQCASRESNMIDTESTPTGVSALSSLSTSTASLTDGVERSFAYGRRAVANAEHLSLHPSAWSMSSSVFVTLESASHSLDIGGNELIGEIVDQSFLVGFQLWRQAVGDVALHLVGDRVQVLLQETSGDFTLSS